MRTTITLDEDVAAKLQAQVRRTGCSFKDAVNNTLRIGLNAKRTSAARVAFKVKARDLGQMRPGLSLDNIGDLLDDADRFDAS